MKKEYFILCFLVLLLGCNDIENCDADQNRNFIVVRFYDLETQESKKVGFTFTAENSPNRFVFAADTTISTASGDTTIISDSTVIGLPLNPEAGISTFYFDSDTSSHQIALSYLTEFSLLDPDCEPSLTFTNLDTVRQTFDSTVVVNSVTNIFVETNIEVYF